MSGDPDIDGGPGEGFRQTAASYVRLTMEVRGLRDTMNLRFGELERRLDEKYNDLKEDLRAAAQTLDDRAKDDWQKHEQRHTRDYDAHMGKDGVHANLDRQRKEDVGRMQWTVGLIAGSVTLVFSAVLAYVLSRLDGPLATLGGCQLIGVAAGVGLMYYVAYRKLRGKGGVRQGLPPSVPRSDRSG